MRYIYLHGFASGETSLKARFFKQKLAEQNIALDIIDWNSSDFATLLFSREIDKIIKSIHDEEVTLIASSMGGVIALNLAQRLPSIKKIILLAPALQINSLWTHILGADNLKLWQTQGYLPIYHGAKKATINLHYDFVSDLQKVNDRDFNLTNNTNILIFHGLNDQTIPYQVSNEFGQIHPTTQIHLLDSDHSLESVLDYIWQHSCTFLNIN